MFAREHQLIRADPRHGTYLACGLLLRGASANISDINRNVVRLRPSLRMAHWNTEVRGAAPGGAGRASIPRLAIRGHCSVREGEVCVCPRVKGHPRLPKCLWSRAPHRARTQGFKLGICSVPPVGVPNSLLCLANNSAITNPFNTMRERFEKLYKRKCGRARSFHGPLRTAPLGLSKWTPCACAPHSSLAVRRVYAHHYEQYMELSTFDHAAGVMADIVAQYEAADASSRAPPPPPPRLRSRGLRFC